VGAGYAFRDAWAGYEREKAIARKASQELEVLKAGSAEAKAIGLQTLRVARKALNVETAKAEEARMGDSVIEELPRFSNTYEAYKAAKGGVKILGKGKVQIGKKVVEADVDVLRWIEAFFLEQCSDLGTLFRDMANGPQVPLEEPGVASSVEDSATSLLSTAKSVISRVASSVGETLFAVGKWFTPVPIDESVTSQKSSVLTDHTAEYTGRKFKYLLPYYEDLSPRAACAMIAVSDDPYLKTANPPSGTKNHIISSLSIVTPEATVTTVSV